MIKYLDKNNSLNKIESQSHVILEIGCGDKKKYTNSIGIDLIDFNSVDIVGNIYNILNDVRDDSVDLIYSSHCFEHLSNLNELMKEISRILKKDGLLEVVVPHFSNPFYYSDPTHKNLFGLYSFSYFADDNILKRQVPKYEILLPLKLISINLIFRSFRPRYLTHSLKKIFQSIFNFNTLTKEFYEENFTSLISCYEIEFTLKKK